ncbi:M20 family metallopeptidase [Paenibacillus sp. GCM10012307]|uniref:Amidohydrolase n=1 Tax=Paenibacillus roseus TaxID=2798579 RepID=A0A934IYM0_9BACL|nr:M20 family metallopeptidase [Paenibacillus roseus]MBJ6360074.1 amidohydrolase [Paenibacillus roseus]
MTEGILDYIDSLKEEIIAIRRDFHRIPEVLFDIPRTSAKVADYLRALGLEVHTHVGKHFGKGVIGILDSGRSGPTIVLRADMDGLPIKEGHQHSFRSEHDGLMHACGHDAHMAILLGAAKALVRYRDHLAGTIKFVFQPAEESAVPSPVDGRMISGGRDMIEAGALDDADLCFALHVWPELPAGTIGIHRSHAMAASSHFHISFQGVNGHHSTPHLAVDALSMATQYITDVKYALATELNPFETNVLCFGTLHAGTAINAIAGESKLSGTYRVLSSEMVDKLHRILESRAEAIASAYGGSYSSQYRLGTPLINHKAAVELTVQAGRTFLVEESVVLLDRPSLAGEDFALYVQKMPGAFAFLGIGDPSGEPVYPLHHPLFEVNEDVLTVGAKLFVQWVKEAIKTDV